LTPQTRWAASPTTSSRAERPLGKADGRGFKPVRSAVGYALLEEELAADAVDPALQRRRSLAQVADDRRFALDVVVDEVELRETALGEEQLAGVRDAHLAPGHLQHDRLVLCHA
jgi:hypothetical protein